MAKQKIKEILNDPKKGLDRTTNSVLSSLFRQLLTLEDVGPDKWQRLMNLWTNNAKSSIPAGSKRSRARGNIEKELSYTNMSWDVFLKAMRFMAYSKIRIDITCTGPLNKKTRTGLEFHISNGFDDIDLMRGGFVSDVETEHTNESEQPLQEEVSQKPNNDGKKQSAKWWQQA